MYVIAAVFAVRGWRYAVETAPKWGPALSAAVIACSILYGGYTIGHERADEVHAALSNRYAALRDHETIPFVDGFDYLNTAPAVRSVLILDLSVPPYYLDVPYVKPFGQWGSERCRERPISSRYSRRFTRWAFRTFWTCARPSLLPRSRNAAGSQTRFCRAERTNL